MKIVRVSKIPKVEGGARRAAFERYRDQLLYIRAQGKGGKVAVVAIECFDNPKKYKRIIEDIPEDKFIDTDFVSRLMKTDVLLRQNSKESPIKSPIIENVFVDEEKTILNSGSDWFVSAEKVLSYIGAKNIDYIYVKAKREGWEFIEKPVRGGHKKYYNVKSLPVDGFVRFQLELQKLYGTAMDEQQKADGLFGTAGDKQRDKANQWGEIIPKWLKYREQAKRSGKNKREADNEFVKIWNMDHEFQISRASLHRKYKAFQEYGIDGLVDKYTNDPRWTADFDPKAKALLLDMYMNSDKGMYPCYQNVLVKAQQENWAVPSYATARRTVLAMAGDTLVRMKYGYKTYDDKAFPSIRRDINSLVPGELYVCDGRMVDVSYGDGKKGTRLWIFAWVDARTKKIMSVTYSDTGTNAQAVLDSFYQAAMEHLPSKVLLDNGKDMIRAARTKKADLVLPKELSAPLELLLGEKNVRFAQFKNAKAKIVERVFRDMSQNCDTSFPGYTSSSIMERSERWEIERKAKDFISRDELIKNLDHWFFEVFNNWAPGKRKKSPNEQWHEYFQTVNKRRVDAETLRHLCIPFYMNRKAKKAGQEGTWPLTRAGVSIKGVDYWDEWLLDFPLNTRVFVRFHEREPEHIWIYDLKGRPLGEVPKYKFSNVSYLDGGELVGEHQAMKKRRDKKNLAKAEEIKRTHGLELSIIEKLSRGDVNPAPEPEVDPETGELIENVEYVEYGHELPKSSKSLNKVAKNKRQERESLDKKIKRHLEKKQMPSSDPNEVFERIDRLRRKTGTE